MYDNDGNVVSNTDALGNATTVVYNAQNELVTKTLPSPDGQSNNEPEWQYAYDAASDKLTETSPLGAVTTYTYDELGRVISVSQPNPATGAARGPCPNRRNGGYL